MLFECKDGSYIEVEKKYLLIFIFYLEFCGCHRGEILCY